MTAEQLAAIPAELKACNNWVCWKSIPDATAHSGVRKVPINPRTGGNASTNKPETWTSFDAAAAAAVTQGYAGIGFVFANSGFFGVDLDDIGDEAGQLDRSEAAAIVNALQTYTERSQSGRGVHCIARGSLPGADMRRGKVEMYAGNRFFVMTGDRLPGTAAAVNDCTESIKPIYDRYRTRPAAALPDQMPAAAQTVRTGAADQRSGSGLTDSEILAKAMQNPRFAALWAGDMSEYDNDHSRADNALAYLLAFWTGRDTVQADRLFRQSGLMRPKWDRAQSGSTYGAITLQRAADAQPTVYGDRRPADRATSEAAAMPADDQTGGSSMPAALPELTDETTADYIRSGQFAAAVDDFRRADGLRTGYSLLDKALNGLFPGLYVIGALPGLGKTTFCLQLADQISAAGRDVLYYSLEISRFDLVSKSLARIAAQQTGLTCLAGETRTALDFRRGRVQPDQLDRARDQYLQTAAQRLTIIEGRKLDAAAVCDHVRSWMQRHDNRRPVVVVDYLQLLAMRGADQRQSAKDYTDAATDALVQLAHGDRLTVLAISSFNRNNYSESAGFAAFKESGLIESSADCVLALQPWILYDRPTDEKTGKKRNPTAAEIETSKGHNPRELDLTVLKSRSGAVGQHIRLNYYTLCDLITEAERQGLDVQPAAAELAADDQSGDQISGAGGEAWQTV